MGKKFTPSSGSQPVVEEQKPVEKPAAVKQTPAKPGDKRPHFTVGYMFAGFMGAEDSFADGYTIYELDNFALDNFASEADLTTWGIDMHLLIPLKYIYWSLGVSYTNQTVWDKDGSYSESLEVFSTVSPGVGIGAIYPVGSNFQL